MKKGPFIIRWACPNAEERTTHVAGVGVYRVKKERHFKWVVFRNDQKTTLEGTSSNEAMEKAEQSIQEYWRSKRRRTR